MSSKTIDERMKKVAHSGPGVFHIEEGMLEKLKPNLILTQELCELCAVGFNQVKKAAKILKQVQDDKLPTIISLEPESVENILDNVRVIGEFGGKEKEAEKKILSLRSRMTKVSSRLAGARPNNIIRPKVLIIEWLDPLMVAGHWVPEMVEIAGGENLITNRGSASKKVTLDQIKTHKPDILVISPCGFDIDRTIREKFTIKNLQFTIKNAKIYLMDGNSYMTRPGPRIIDGIEILAEILHPDPPAGGFPKKHGRKDWIEYR